MFFTEDTPTAVHVRQVLGGRCAVREGDHSRQAGRCAEAEARHRRQGRGSQEPRREAARGRGAGQGAGAGGAGHPERTRQPFNPKSQLGQCWRGERGIERRSAGSPCNATLRQNRQRKASRETEPMRSADRSAYQTIGAREDGERIARNRRCCGGADRRHVDHVGARRRRRQASQGKERKRRPDARHNGGSHWENRVKRQHDFDPQSFD